MKAHPRDHLIIAAAFVSVSLCGYGIGHLVGQQRADAAKEAAAEVPAWQAGALRSLQRKLDLRPEQVPLVETELALVAEQVRHSRDQAAFAYLWHIQGLYERLIAMLDASQADLLREEKRALEMEIEQLLPYHEDGNPK
jgi:hypothetical protein